MKENEKYMKLSKEEIKEKDKNYRKEASWLKTDSEAEKNYREELKREHEIDDSNDDVE